MATPGYGHVPFNPIHGDQANLRQDGTTPYCAMMQVAAEDTYDDYVICRGFDPRILRFIDYAEGDPNKPGISVAKPFGKRTPGTYEIAEVYPAFLPTQGNAGFADFRQVIFTPPSPVDVHWRVGQNPGVTSGGLEGGQPESLSDEIEILYDHNGKVINWLLIDSNISNTQMVVFELTEDLDSGIGEEATATVVAHNDPALAVDDVITVVNTGMSKGYSTARGLAIKIKTLADGVKWWVIEVDQFCLQYTCKLTTDTHGYSGSGIPTPGSRDDQIVWSSTDTKALTPYPFSYVESQEVHNPFNIHGKTGDTLLCAHIEAGYTYDFGDGEVTCKNIIIAVYPDKAREFFIKLTSDVGTGDITPTLAAKGWGPIGDNSGEIPGAGETPVDRYYHSHLGKTDHTGIVSYDLYHEEYVVKHLEHWATRVKATFASDWCDSRTDFTVDVVTGMNGEPPSSPLTVKNRYGIRAAKAGDPIDVLWDQIEGEWYPERTSKSQPQIEFTITGISTASTGPYTGKIIASGTVETAPCELACLIGTGVSVVDHSGCVFDLPEEELIGVWAWASERIALSTASSAEEGELTPCHWAADDRCCTASEGGSGGSSGG